MTTDGREYRVSHAAIYFAPCSRHGIGVSSRRRQHFSSAFWFDPRLRASHRQLTSSTSSTGEASVRSAAAGRRPPRACRPSRMCSTSGRSTAASGRPPTTAGPGSRSSTTSRPARSARSRSRRPIPNIIYVGSGEGLQRPDLSTGDGIYKSTDAGKTWTHLGLRDGQQIPQIVVDPHESRSAVRRRARPSVRAERGARRLPLDRRRQIVREGALQGREHRRHRRRVRSRRTRITSTPCCGRRARGRGRTARSAGPGSGLFKSTDGGTHLAAADQGPADLRRDGLGRIGIAIAPSDPQRLYATVECAARPAASTAPTTRARTGRAINRRSARRDARRRLRRGQGRSEEPGHRLHRERRDVEVDRRRQDVHARCAARRAATTTTASGSIPTNPDIILIAVRPGRDRHRQRRRDVELAGTTSRPRSSTTSAPTTRSRTASAAASRRAARRASQSRGDDGRITFRDWHPGRRRGIRLRRAGSARSRHRLRRQGHALRPPHRQVQHVAPQHRPRRGDYRVVRTQPVLFSPVDPHTLYFASNTLWKTTTGGNSWTQISPDLTREDVGRSRRTSASTAARPRRQPTQRGVIYTIAPSPLDINRIWAGTDDGLIHVTSDGGKTWNDVTPPELTPWAKVSMIDASHFDRARRVRRGQHAPPRRSAAAHLSHARRRQDLDADHERHLPDGAHDQRGARGSEAQGPAVRRHRDSRSTSRSTTASTGSRCG